MRIKKIIWDEPNRANLPLLNISQRGKRYSSLAGVRWIDDYRLVANHNSGLRIALFDIRLGPDPILLFDTPHRTDDIAVKKIHDHLYEIVVSGCWDAGYSIYHLNDDERIQFTHIATQKNKNRSFSHGVSYDRDGEICVTYSTGLSPRIEMKNKAWVMPGSWGARFVSYDKSGDCYYAVCTTETPKLHSYASVDTSVWILDEKADVWRMVSRIPDTHSDSCQFFRERLWIPDQANDRIIGLDFREDKNIQINGTCFSFPHGLSISTRGTLAVTNYGDSSITLLDLNEVIQNQA